MFLLLQIVQSLLVGASRPFVLCTSECFDSKVAQDLIVGQLAMCNLLAQSNVRALACRNFIVGSRLSCQLDTQPTRSSRNCGVLVSVLQCCRPLGKEGAVNPIRGAQAGDIWAAAMVVLRILVYVWQTPPKTLFLFGSPNTRIMDPLHDSHTHTFHLAFWGFGFWDPRIVRLQNQPVRLLGPFNSSSDSFA